jgi:hypothetical protein
MIYKTSQQGKWLKMARTEKKAIARGICLSASHLRHFSGRYNDVDIELYFVQYGGHWSLM